MFITGQSHGSAMLLDFEKNATVIDVSFLVQYGFTQNWLTRKIETILSNQKQTILFGCNSKYFYQLINSISLSNARAIDLIHAFVHEYEDGPEKWSLAVVEKLAQRIVINSKTKNDLIELYEQNNLQNELVKKIIYISNFTESQDWKPKHTEPNLIVTYVGRGGEEKRIHLIAQLAQLSAQSKLMMEFHFVGNMGSAIPNEFLPFCNLL